MSLRVDDLTQELRARAEAAQRSRAQFEGLLDAVTAVSEDLELSEVLARIVRSACSLVSARYGALGVLGPDGKHLTEFISHGVTPEERESIGDPPSGHGILGMIIRDPRPQRLSDIGAHPESVGFPPNHPPMRSFVGAPIRIRDEVFGNLYLAERQGNKEFTEADEAMLVALAGAAGFAIENARLYERSRQQRAWAEGISELTRGLLQGEEEDLAITALAKTVLRLTRAQVCVVALREEQGAPPRVRAVCRRDSEGSSGDGSPVEVLREAASPVLSDVPHLESRWADWTDVLGSKLNLLLPREGAAGHPGGFPMHVAKLARFTAGGPTAIVPISTGRGDVGHLVVQWHSGHEDAAATALPVLSTFAQQVALALVAARAQHDRSLLAMLEDRDRIARDMHDHVIQRLFATGLSLQAAQRLAIHPVVRARLDEAVTSLDEAIKDIRSTIFELRSPTPGRALHDELDDVVRTAGVSLGFTPTLDLVGGSEPADAALRADLLAVVREALANVSRHAHAHSASVVVTLGTSLSVTVTDDGSGIGADDRRSGLANLEHRAAARSGTLHVTPAWPRGTKLVWTVPP